MVDYKKLRKLAKVCQESGITRFKCADFEFTLTDKEGPQYTPTKAKTSAQPELSSTKDSTQSDDLSEEELLFWSSGGVQEQ